MVVLFIDLLGSKSRWHKGGRAAAVQCFDHFAKIMADAIGLCDVRTIRDGVIETDAAAILFDSVDEALNCAREAYVMAFEGAKDSADERLWFRGSIMRANAGSVRRTETPVISNVAQVRLSVLDGALLDAIAVEKGGFKGMRLLIDETLVDKALGTRFSIKLGERSFIPFKHLHNSVYPGRLESGYKDYFWMATKQDEQWERRKVLMSSRLRWSSRDAEEFIQAAATQVVFHECAAIINSLSHRGK